MCAICGCGMGNRRAQQGKDAHPHELGLVHGHVHEHGHPHAHEHGHVHDEAHGQAHGQAHAHAHEQGHMNHHVHDEAHAQRQGQEHHASHEDEEGRIVRFETELLAKNDRIAAENRRWLEDRGTVALNLIGAPGSGKTTLLERTIQLLSPSLPISVLEGDQETELDAQRIRKAGAPVIQINTGSGCHLNARMVGSRLRELAPRERSLVFIENVGNLVCPALFDVGERAKVVVMSITEGEEKPLKYPQIFRASQALVLTKIDLLMHLQFDLHRCLENARSVNPYLRIFTVSSTTGIGIGEFHKWLWRLFVSETAVAGGG